MSEQKELERLQAKRAELEAESRSLKEEQKNLKDRLLILEEEIAIEELEDNNKATREAIAQLESKMNDLEARLKPVPQIHETPPTATEVAPEVVAAPEKPEEALAPAETAPEEHEEDIVTVTAIEEPMVESQEELGESLKKQQEKKKRKFF